MQSNYVVVSSMSGDPTIISLCPRIRFSGPKETWHKLNTRPTLGIKHKVLVALSAGIKFSFQTNSSRSPDLIFSQTEKTNLFSIRLFVRLPQDLIHGQRRHCITTHNILYLLSIAHLQKCESGPESRSDLRNAMKVFLLRIRDIIEIPEGESSRLTARQKCCYAM